MVEVTQQRPNRAHLAGRAGVGVLVVVLAALVVVRAGGDTGQADDDESGFARLTMPAELSAGAEFDVSIVLRDQLQPHYLALVPSIALQADGRRIGSLTAAYGSYPPRYDAAADEPQVVDTVDLVGTGPFRFVLPPELAPGEYELCGRVTYMIEPDDEPKSVLACAALTTREGFLSGVGGDTGPSGRSSCCSVLLCVSRIRSGCRPEPRTDLYAARRTGPGPSAGYSRSRTTSWWGRPVSSVA